MKRLLSLILIVLIILPFVPITAKADGEPPLLTVEDNFMDYAYISWNYNSDYSDGAVIEKSTDGDNWVEVADVDYNGYSVELSPKKVEYFRVNCYRNVTDKSTGETVKFFEGATEPVTLCASLYEASGSPYCAVSANKKKIQLTYEYSSYYYPYTDGFDIYKGVNGGELKFFRSLSVKKYKSKDDYCYYYSIKDKAPNKNAYNVKYLFVPYFKANGRKFTFRNDDNVIDARYANKGLVSAETYSDKVKIRLNNLGGTVKYKIRYTKYNRKSGKTYKTVTKTTGKKSYTIKDAKSKKYGYRLKITPSWSNGYASYTVDYDSQGAEALMNNRTESDNQTIKVINTRGSKSYKHWSYSLTDKERTIIQKFFEKKYKGKYPSRAEMAKYAFDWIHKKVDYDYSYKRVTASYVESIFKNRAGQCLQYNGAMAAVLTYLGYEARVIEGYRARRNGTPSINHYWCEIKINGEWYLMETGNEGKNGSWQHFCEPYRYGDGYTKNGKLVVPKS